MKYQHVLFFDSKESDYQRLLRDYPTAFHAWNAEDAAKWVTDRIEAEEPVEMVCIGYIPDETDLFVSWLILNNVKITYLIVHTRSGGEAENITGRLTLAGYEVNRKTFGVNWMRGVNPCPNC